GLLFVLLAIQLGKHFTSLRGTLLTLLAMLVAAAIVVSYLRFDVTRQLLRLTAVGPLVFVLLFALVSPSSAVFLGGDRAEAAEARVVGPNPPIVIIIFDELPLRSLLAADGSIDADRFPNFARVAGEST